MALKKFSSSIIDALMHVFGYLTGLDRRRRPSVELYPDIISAKTSDDLFPKTRGFLHNDLNVCTGCGDCITACPVSALRMDSTTRVDGSIDVKRFSIDLGRCYFCSVCVDVCPVNSIKHTSAFEMAVPKLQQMVLEMTKEESDDSALGSRQKDLRKFRSYEVRR